MSYHLIDTDEIAEKKERVNRCVQAVLTWSVGFVFTIGMYWVMK